MRVQPDEGLSLRFGAKVPGHAFRVQKASMDFSYESFEEQSPDAYERVILDALIGDPTLFIRADEVGRSWRIVDPVHAVLGRRRAAHPAVPGGHLGSAGGRRADRPRRPELAPLDLTRDRVGGPTRSADRDCDVAVTVPRARSGIGRTRVHGRADDCGAERGADMTQDVRADVDAVIEQVMADHTVSTSEMLGVPREIASAVEQAGLTTSTGTIAFAGQYASGSFAVQYNSPTGGFSSTWPEWAFKLAKDALLGNAGSGWPPTATPSGRTWSSS